MDDLTDPDTWTLREVAQFSAALLREIRELKRTHSEQIREQKDTFDRFLSGDYRDLVNHHNAVVALQDRHEEDIESLYRFTGEDRDRRLVSAKRAGYKYGVTPHTRLDVQTLRDALPLTALTNIGEHLGLYSAVAPYQGQTGQRRRRSSRVRRKSSRIRRKTSRKTHRNSRKRRSSRRR